MSGVEPLVAGLVRAAVPHLSGLLEGGADLIETTLAEIAQRGAAAAAAGATEEAEECLAQSHLYLRSKGVRARAEGYRAARGVLAVVVAAASGAIAEGAGAAAGALRDAAAAVDPADVTD